MKIIVGLGNPGKEYKNTRHNIGFNLLEELDRRFTIEKEESKFDAIIGHIRIHGEKVLLVKPLTYMNLSGRAVQPLMNWWKCELDDLMVVYDDMDLELGKIRIRATGGTGGHKGLASIIERLAERDFPRMRLGIGRPEHQNSAGYVLGKFLPEEEPICKELIHQAADACQLWVKSGIVLAMNQYNKVNSDNN